jgi:hypothetical protein
MNELPAITAVRVERHMLSLTVGMALLHIHFADGRVASTDTEQKMARIGVPAVYLGWDFEADQSATIPANPADGGTEQTVIRGATSDPRVVKLVKRFVRDVRGGRFRDMAAGSYHDYDLGPKLRRSAGPSPPSRRVIHKPRSARWNDG